jgi:hypothetical protein
MGFDLSASNALDPRNRLLVVSEGRLDNVRRDIGMLNFDVCQPA